jgi:pimeloyl-ACP methyl ester carboxylesterase
VPPAGVAHRGGSGPPLVCLHGFTDTWRTWELVLPALERRHDVLAPNLAGHAGGPPIQGKVDNAVLADSVERAMDEAGFDTAHIAGNSLGGYVALQLAERGRARTVAAFAPAGGWAEGDDSYQELLRLQARLIDTASAAARMRRPSSPHPRAGAARRATSPRASSTSPPSCSRTRSAGWPPARR